MIQEANPDLQRDISVGGAIPEAASATPHQGGCNISRSIFAPAAPTALGGAKGMVKPKTFQKGFYPPGKKGEVFKPVVVKRGRR